MKKFFILLLVILSLSKGFSQNVGINATGATPHTSAMLDVSSTNKGMLIPRMTSAQRTAIATPATGLMVYDTDNNGFWFYSGAGWVQLAAGGATNYWSLSGSNIFNNNAGNVGIGTAAPIARFHIKGTADTTQLLIDANATQSNTRPLIKLRNSGGFELIRIHSDDTSNVFIGRNVGRVNDAPGGGNFNSFIGSQSGYSNTAGSENTANGYAALYSNTIGGDNTANGSYALFSNTTGTRNIANGAYALSSNTTGHQNTANGVFALYNNTTANYNTATGSQALFFNTTGAQNTAIGANALEDNFTGYQNTAIGYQALFGITNGSNNTAIGAGAGILTGFNRNNTVTVGYNSITSENNLALLGNTATTLNGGYGIGGWANFSDGRFKKNIKENVPGIEFIKALRPVTYTLDMHGLDQFIYKDKSGEYEKAMADGIAEKEKIVETGFIAQEVETAAKKMGYDFDGVHRPKDLTQGHYTISYSSFVVPLVKAVQEQQVIIETLRKQVEAASAAEIPAIVGKQQSIIEELKKQMAEMKKEIELLKNKN